MAANNKIARLEEEISSKQEHAGIEWQQRCTKTESSLQKGKIKYNQLA